LRADGQLVEIVEADAVAGLVAAAERQHPVDLAIGY
jgi:hypothetical protein